MSEDRTFTMFDHHTFSSLLGLDGDSSLIEMRQCERRKPLQEVHQNFPNVQHYILTSYYHMYVHENPFNLGHPCPPNGEAATAVTSEVMMQPWQMLPATPP